MKGTTILLLGAATLVAYASAHPYSKIPESILQDKYNYRKSSSNSNSNSYSQSNHDESDVNGAFGGQTFTGSKSSGYSTNGGSQSHSSSFSSSSLTGNVPLGIYGFPGVLQSANTYSESSLALGNPGTAGLGLSQGSNFASGSQTSYGAGNEGSTNSGSYNDQITQEGHQITQVGGNTGAGFGSNGEASFGQGGSATIGSSGASGSGYFGQANPRPGAVQYWWNGPNNPFEGSRKPSGGCTSNACSLAGTFDLNQASGGAHASNQAGQVDLNIHSSNPFFNGQGGSGSGFISSGAAIGQSSTGSNSGSSVGSGIGAGAGAGSGTGSKNPFLDGSYSSGAAGSGQHAASESSASSNANTGSISSGSGSSSSIGSSGSFTGAGNPFLNSGSGSGQIPQGFGQAPTAIPNQQVHQKSDSVNTGAGSLNPFFQTGSGSVVITPPVADFPDQLNQVFVQPSPTPGFEIQSTVSGLLVPQQPSIGFPSTPLPSGFPATSGVIISSGAGDFQDQAGQIPSFISQSPIDSGISAGDFQSQVDQISSFGSQSSISSDGSLAGYSTPSSFIPEEKPSEIDAGLTVSCSGQGICVSKNLCENGKFTGDQQGLTQVRSGTQFCKVGLEVCCTLNQYQSGSSSSFGSASSGSSSNSNFESTGNYGGSSEGSDKPGATGSSGQSTVFTETQGQSGQFGSDDNYQQTGNYDQSQSSGSSGIFGQKQQSGSAGSYDQSQQKESFNFGAQSDSKASSSSSFGSRGESGLVQGFPSGFTSATQGPDLISVTPGFPTRFSSVTPGPDIISVTPGIPVGFSSVTPEPSLISVTPGYGFRKPIIVGGIGDDSGIASAVASADAEASGQASSGISGIFINPSPTPSNGGIFGNSKQSEQSSGGLFGSSVNSGEDLSSGELSFNGPFTGLKGAAESNGYLPPIGSEQSNNVPAYSELPKEESKPTDVVIDKRPLPRPTFIPVPIAIPVGCAAALICVEEQFCTMEGVISPEPIALTSQQIERRAPLSSCRNPDNGIIGKCCRDPNYVDPWPTGNLPANYTGGFDEQGFPTYLNISKVRPPKKQPPPTKGGFRQPTTGPGASPGPNNKDIFTDIGNFWQGLFNNKPDKPAVSDRPQSIPVVKPDENPTDTDHSEVPSSSDSNAISSDVTQAPDKTDLILGIFPRPPWLNGAPSFSFPPIYPFGNDGSKIYDSSATNQSPIIIAPHIPGAQCGLKNQVLRPAGLEKDDVAFGEIPWQAMILSTNDRKLLCSGAIVAPYAVLTSAQCVHGFNSGEVSIKAGEWKLGYELKHEEPLPFEIVKVFSIVAHPGFQPGSPSHDFAILFLERPLTLDQHVDTICLGDIPQPQPGRKCIATGWGKVVLQVNVAGSLMHSIDVDVLSQNECRQRLQGAESQIEVDNSLTCVKAHNQWNNMCQVDFGGPLACDRGDGYYELTGVYSKDTGCLPTNQVATFALIDTNWVKQSLLSPPRLPIPSYGLPNQGEIPSSSNIQPNFGAQIKQPAATCECQKNHLGQNVVRITPQ